MFYRSIGTATLLLTAALAATGCGPKADVANKPPDGVLAGKVTPLTDAKAERYGHALEAAVKAGDLAALERLIDWDAITEAALAPTDLPDAKKKAGAAGLKKGINGPGGFSHTLAKAVAGGGSYKWLRTRRNKQGDTTVLFRLMGADGALNYHELTIVSRPKGAVVATDIYVLLTGESLVETLQRIYMMLAAAEGKPATFFSKGEGPKDNRTEAVIAMTKAQRENKPQDAVAYYKSLPLEVQNQKSIKIQYLMATMKLDEKQYLAAIDDYEKQFPGDPSLDLVSIDGFLLKQQNDKALATIERLSKSLGGDPYIDGMRGTLLLRVNKPDEAEKVGREAMKADPTLEGGYDAVIGASLMKKSYATTVEMLNLVDGKFGATAEQIAATPDFADFVKSPEYKAWIAQRKGASPGAAKPGNKPSAGPPAGTPGAANLRHPDGVKTQPGAASRRPAPNN